MSAGAQGRAQAQQQGNGVRLGDVQLGRSSDSRLGQLSLSLFSELEVFLGCMHTPDEEGFEAAAAHLAACPPACKRRLPGGPLTKTCRPV